MKLCADCGKRPTRTWRAKRCIECQRAFHGRLAADRRGRAINDPTCQRCQAAPKTGKGPMARYCDDCRRVVKLEAQQRWRKSRRGLDEPMPLCADCGREGVVNRRTSFCERCKRERVEITARNYASRQQFDSRTRALKALALIHNRIVDILDAPPEMFDPYEVRRLGAAMQHIAVSAPAVRARREAA